MYKSKPHHYDHYYNYHHHNFHDYHNHHHRTSQKFTFLYALLVNGWVVKRETPNVDGQMTCEIFGNDVWAELPQKDLRFESPDLRDDLLKNNFVIKHLGYNENIIEAHHEIVLMFQEHLMWYWKYLICI